MACDLAYIINVINYFLINEQMIYKKIYIINIRRIIMIGFIILCIVIILLCTDWGNSR